MTDITEIISVLRYFLRQQTKVNRVVTSQCFSDLGRIARDSGLTEDTLILCSEFFLKKCDTSTMAQMVIKCMLPTSFVPDQAVINVLIWIKVNFRRRFTQGVALSLQWIAGLLEFKLVNEQTINNFYSLFLALMDFKHTQILSCWLVSRLSKPTDVDRGLVLNVLNLKKKSRSTCLDSVLWCFKTLKPECVPEYIQARNMMSNLRINKLFKECFSKSHENNIKHGLNVERGTSDSIWKLSDGRKRRRLETIPGIEYVNFGSSLYREREKSLLEIKNWKQLSTHFWNIALPCNSMSLLQNSFGHHLVIFRGPLLQHRFSYILYSTLSVVVIDRTINIPLSEQELFLNKLCELQEFMQLGIPVVSRFLATYIPFWDGFTLLPQMLRLLPWVTFSSYDELHHLYLVHIYYLFISVNVNVKCGILKMFRKLITVLASEKDSTDEKLFIHPIKSEPVNEIYAKLLKFVTNLCVIGLNIEPESATLLSQVLHFYEHLTILEVKTDLSVRSVLPAVAMYYSLFSRNLINLERVCGLLLIYNTYCSIQSRHLTIALHKPTKYVTFYLHDFLNILWLKKGIRHRKNGLVFRGLNQSQESFLPSQLDTSLSLYRYPPLMLLHKGQNDSVILKNIVRNLMPNVYKLLRESVKYCR